MVLTNYPSGVSSFGVPVIGPGAGSGVEALPLINTGGRYWFVSSVAGNNGNQGTFDSPFATWAFAADATSGNTALKSGDVIVLLPGHAETVVAAAGIPMATEGVRVVGIGVGAARPTITFGTSTAASVAVTAADVSISNIIGVGTIDGLLNPFNVTGSGFMGIIEWQDSTNLIEAVCAVKATTVSNFNLAITYKGFADGSGTVSGVKMTAVTGARVVLDLYGYFTTAAVQFVTTACTNVHVEGRLYNYGATGNKTVVDTATGSTWDAEVFDVTVGAYMSGGSAAALAQDDVSAVLAASVAGTTDAVTNAYVRDVVGNKADAAVYVPGTTKSVLAYNKGQTDAMEKCVCTTAATMVAATDDLFTIAGGPIELVSLVGVFQTVNTGAASTFQIQANATAGGATVMSIASASTSGAAAGTYLVLPAAAGSAVTAVAGGAHLNLLPATFWTIPVGKIQAIVGAANTVGTVQWYLRYKPMAPGVTVTAAY